MDSRELILLVSIGAKRRHKINKADQNDRLYW